MGVIAALVSLVRGGWAACYVPPSVVVAHGAPLVDLPVTSADGSYLGMLTPEPSHGVEVRPSAVVFVDDDLVLVDPHAETARIAAAATNDPPSEELWRAMPKALRDLLTERAKQDVRFGVSNHDPMLWMTILGEEYGELCKAVMQTRYGGVHGGVSMMRAEAIQVAAVAIAMVQSLDRNAWQWGTPRPEDTCS